MPVGSKKGSVIFSDFRALGLYSNHIPHVVRYHKKHREFYAVTAVGNCFHTYNVSAYYVGKCNAKASYLLITYTSRQWHS